MKNYLLLVLLLFFPTSCFAQQDPASTLKLAAPIADHMVLQHGQPTSVWGMAKPEVAVTIDFAGQTIQATADANGQWKATLTPLSINAEPSSLTVTAADGNKITVNDVLVGEVWMCSGQSNMQWTLTKTKDPAVKQADLPAVRLFTTVSKTSDSIQSDCEGDWKLCTPKSAAGFSAVGFHFGKELSETLNVPIGLVDTSWGGKKVEAFTSVDKLKTVQDALPLVLEWEDRADSYDPELAKTKYSAALKKWKAERKAIIAATAEGQKPKLPRKPKPPVQPRFDTSCPGAIFNQKVAPWTNYAVAGAIWYQGESNTGRAVQYESLLTALIEDWRGRWGQ